MKEVPDSAATGVVKVFFVDDEENILKSLRRLFADEGVETLTFPSADEALEALRKEEDVGVIVSDQRMPGTTGVQFLEQARVIRPDALRVLLTGYADIEAVVGAINRGGAYRYITKPWREDELVQTVREGVRTYTLARENWRLGEIIKAQNEELKNWNDQLQYFVQEQTLDIQRKNATLEKLNEGLKKNFKSTISAFSSLIELRSRLESGHSKNVAEVSVGVARAMGLSTEEAERIAVASLLHDIGKIGFSDVMLQLPPEKMSEDELAEYRRHPVRSQAAIDCIESLRDAGVLARHHHERFDGSGFPDRLKGDAIPVGARIIAAADFVDRTARLKYACADVGLLLREVMRGKGSRFDPEILPFLEKVVAEKFKDLCSEDSVEMELLPEDLRVGMVISRDVKSGTGILLLKAGVELDEGRLQAVRRFYQIDPAKKGIFVFINRQ